MKYTIETLFKIAFLALAIIAVSMLHKYINTTPKDTVNCAVLAYGDSNAPYSLSCKIH